MWGIPLAIFDHVGRGVLVADEHGGLKCCNVEAANLLDCDPALALGNPCWRVGRLRTPEGELICGIDCPIRKQVRAGERPACRLVAHYCRDGGQRIFELHSFPIMQEGSGRPAVLHLIEPVPAAQEERCSAPSPLSVQRCATGLCSLSPREQDVLTLLAAGMPSHGIANALEIEPVTVRNHVQAILRKLHLHRRIDAVLAWIESGQAGLRC